MKWLATLLLCGCVSTDDLLYSPHSLSRDHYSLPFAVDEYRITTPDGKKLGAVMVPVANTDVAVIYFHGRINDLEDVPNTTHLEQLSHLGFNAVAFDYRGFGVSTGSPSEQGLRTDSRAVLTDLRAKGMNHFIYYGHSLGGAVAIDLAASDPPDVLMTESTFTSIAAAGRDLVGVDAASAIIEGKWDSLSKIASIQSPYLAFHGLADVTLNYRYSQELVAAHPGTHQLILVPGANHINLPETLGDQFLLDMVAFLSRINF